MPKLTEDALTMRDEMKRKKKRRSSNPDLSPTPASKAAPPTFEIHLDSGHVLCFDDEKVMKAFAQGFGWGFGYAGGTTPPLPIEYRGPAKPEVKAQRTFIRV